MTIDVSKLDFAECEQLNQDLELRLQQLREAAKAEMLERAARMGLELVPAVKKRKPRGSKRTDLDDANHAAPEA